MAYIEPISGPQVIRYTLFNIQVCVPKTFSDSEVEEFAERKCPCGTTKGWTIRRDEGILLYDIFIIAGQGFYLERIRRPESGNIEVSIELENDLEPDQIFLMMYGYDARLSEYMTYNVSIKPNTYHTHYSTVENGYGCFGSLNLFEETVSL